MLSAAREALALVVGMYEVAKEPASNCTPHE
jgi:hypothetical protein